MIPALTFATYAVTLNGEPVLRRVRAATLAGRVWLPLRAVGTATGAHVQYDARTHVVTVRRGERRARIASNVAGRGAAALAGTTYVPIRIAAGLLGLDVAYDHFTRTVSLRDRAPSAAALPLPTAAPVLAPRTALPATIVLQPSPGTEVHEPYPAVSARFAGSASIDPTSLRVLVDGTDVTAEAAVVGDEVLWTPRRALAPGGHTVSVSARDATGVPLAHAWSFVDTFAFAPPPPPTPFPLTAIWIDRWITPGTNAFDVFVQGVPGITGYVGVDGVPGFFPLVVSTATAYVAHVVVPVGVNQPFARVAARLTLPSGDVRTIVLPQRISVITPPAPAPAPSATPRRGLPRIPLGTPAPGVTPTATPRPTPVATPRPTPVATPRARPRKPIATPSPEP